MLQRVLYLLRFYITLILIFVTQKVVFMVFNLSHADGAPFGECVKALWHGLPLDSVAACYLIIVPVIVVIVSCFFKQFNLRRVLTPYYAVAAVLMALIFVADVVLYFFWGAKLDANDLIYAAKPKDVLINIKWWALLLALLVLGLLVWHYLRRLRHATPERLAPLASRWASLVGLPLIGLTFLGMRGSVSESTANPSFAYFSNHAYCNHAALNPFFNMMHSLFKVQDIENEFVFVDDEEARRVAEPYFVHDAAVVDTLLTPPRPDILLLVWEGAGWEMVMNDSVAPGLMKIAGEGVLFSNCYADNFRTDRGLVSILSGWMGMPTASLMKMSDKCQRLPGLAASLRRTGYETSFIYGGDVDFTNMRGYMLETGFQTVKGSAAFPVSRRLSSWGAPDAYTMLPAVLGFDGSKDGKCAKRFTTLLTLSSHEPWDVPTRRLRNERLNAFAYTDSCLTVLVDSLKASPRWDSLLVIIVPDHGIPLDASQSSSDINVPHIPIVWTGGAVRKPCTIDVMMMQSDLAATLLAQLAVPFGDFPFSRNVLSPSFAAIPHFAVHAFKNGLNFIDSTGITRFDCADRSSMPVAGSPLADHPRLIQILLQYLYQTTARI